MSERLNRFVRSTGGKIPHEMETTSLFSTTLKGISLICIVIFSGPGKAYWSYIQHTDSEQNASIISS